MTALLLDIGNSRLKWVLAASVSEPLPAAQAIAHEGDMASAVLALSEHWQGALPTAVFVAHVTGPTHEAAIAQALQAVFGCSPQFARSSAKHAGLSSAYAEPARLGVDRWLAMLALWSRTHQAFCVASAGTALTFDAVDASGQHQGGVIAPGLAALIDTTLGRTRFAVGEMQAVFTPGLGQDTEACVRQGALHSAAGLLDRLGAQHAGGKWLAGGDAALLAPQLGASWKVDTDLVFQGLAVWAQQR